MPPLKQKRKKRPRRGTAKNRRFRLPLLGALLLLIAATIAAAVYLIFLRPASEPPVRELRAIEIKKRPPPGHAPPAPASPRPETPAAAKPAAPAALVAIIIDDMGYREAEGKGLLALDLDLTFAFLPFAPHTAEQMRLAAQRHRDILLHLPMEATDPKWDPGPGTLYRSMTATEMAATLRRDLDSVPLAIGINNHMGSAFTADREAMRLFLGLLRKRHLFFVDSLTTPRSSGSELARQLGIPTAERQIFLDNEQNGAEIKKQLDALILLAKKHGKVVGIAHPHRASLEALQNFAATPHPDVTFTGIHALVQ